MSTFKYLNDLLVSKLRGLESLIVSKTEFNY